MDDRNDFETRLARIVAIVLVIWMVCSDLKESLYAHTTWGNVSEDKNIFIRLLLWALVVVQALQAAAMAGVSNIVIMSQGNLLDVFMNAAALIIVMEIDDHVGAYCMQSFELQSKML